MFFHSWHDILRAVVVSASIFLLIVGVLRVSGQQALAKMSGYDVVFTITLGSVVATVAVTRDITVSEGLAAVVTMLVLQEIIRWSQSRYLAVHHMVRQAPCVVLWDGQLLEDRLRADNISGDEVRAAVRRAGLSSLEDAQAVVLENDGDWSVIKKREYNGDDSAFFGLPIPGRELSRENDGAEAIPASLRRIP